MTTDNPGNLAAFTNAEDRCTCGHRRDLHHATHVGAMCEQCHCHGFVRGSWDESGDALTPWIDAAWNDGYRHGLEARATA